MPVNDWLYASKISTFMTSASGPIQALDHEKGPGVSIYIYIYSVIRGHLLTVIQSFNFII